MIDTYDEGDFVLRIWLDGVKVMKHASRLCVRLEVCLQGILPESFQEVRWRRIKSDKIHVVVSCGEWIVKTQDFHPGNQGLCPVTDFVWLRLVKYRQHSYLVRFRISGRKDFLKANFSRVCCVVSVADLGDLAL